MNRPFVQNSQKPGRIESNESIMKEKCLCEDCDSKRILKHFERCPKCFSTAYHGTPRKLNPEPKSSQSNMKGGQKKDERNKI